MSKLMKRLALTHSIPTDLITELMEDAIAKRYPDIGEYKFLGRNIQYHINGTKRYSEGGFLGYHPNCNPPELCQVELYQHILTVEGKEFARKNKMGLRSFEFTVAIAVDLDSGFHPIYSNTLFELPFLDAAINVRNELKKECNEDNITSDILENIICISSINEPRILFETLSQKGM